jgi:hypothetical protein
VVKERGFNNVTVEEVVQAGLRIQIPIISRFNRVSGSGFGSRRAKMTHKSSVADSGCLSRIRMLTFYPSRIPDPRVKKAPDPQHCTKVEKNLKNSCFEVLDVLF